MAMRLPRSWRSDRQPNLCGIRLPADDHRAVSITHAAAATGQGVSLGDIWICMNRNRGDFQLTFAAKVQRLDVLEDVLESIRAGRDFVLCQRVKHERIIGSGEWPRRSNMVLTTLVGLFGEATKYPRKLIPPQAEGRSVSLDLARDGKARIRSVDYMPNIFCIFRSSGDIDRLPPRLFITLKLLEYGGNDSCFMHEPNESRYKRGRSFWETTSDRSKYALGKNVRVSNCRVRVHFRRAFVRCQSSGVPITALDRAADITDFFSFGYYKANSGNVTFILQMWTRCWIRQTDPTISRSIRTSFMKLRSTTTTMPWRTSFSNSASRR